MVTPYLCRILLLKMTPEVLPGVKAGQLKATGHIRPVTIISKVNTGHSAKVKLYIEIAAQNDTATTKSLLYKPFFIWLLVYS